ncbi:aminopeptidase N-like isoform X2 [Chironomus tepperi]|uniref:aminopeptidase N-like isoform X2 n=1 Tax=Chironomus tepperi TaxID=113505 RepID=UPI00391F2087
MEILEQSNQNLSYRLPINSIPLSYEIIIKSNIHENDFEFSGKQTPPMQTYLLAFVISNFQFVNAKASRIPQRIFAKPSSILNDEAHFAADIVGLILKAQEEHFGIEYPLKKLDHVALPHFIFGAMENFGLIIYLERALLIDEYLSKENEEGRKMTIIRIITHEVLHQFFGNIVSPKWWNYTWLSEGLATLYEIYIANIIFPEYNFMNRFITVNMPLSFNEDIMGSWSMSHYTEQPNELRNYFSKIGFEKSGCILRMFQEAITPTTFAKGLNIYLKNSFMKAVTPSDLHKGLQKAYNLDYPSKPLNIGKLMSSWENQAGYPVVTVRIYGTYLILSQRRYPSSNGEIYSIPLTFATKSDPDFTIKMPKIWFNTSSMPVSYSIIEFNMNDWIIFNIQQVGYYRVDYDTKLWRVIINQLIENANLIHSFNRAVLQDEIYLAWTDFKRVTAFECLDILSYFDKEDEPIAWSKAQALMTNFHNRLFGTCIFRKLLEFFQNITNPHINAHGFEAIEGESSSIKSLRISTKAWNCRVLGVKCLTHELLKLKKYLSTRKKIPIDFCAAFRNLDEKTFDYLINLVSINLQFENRENFLNTFGCSLNENNLRKFLEMSINYDNVLTEIERKNILKNTPGKSVPALNITLEFIRENYIIICSRMTSSSINEILLAISACINTHLHISELEAIMLKFMRDKVINEENLLCIRKQYLGNIKWQSDNYNAVESWVLRNIKLNKKEMKKYNTCREIHNMNNHIVETKKRKFFET